MHVFADTSGLYALIDADDRFHSRASRAWRDLLSAGSGIALHQFVLLETWSLLQARLGLDAVEVFVRDFLPLMRVEPVSEPLLSRAMTRCRAARVRDLSLTDCVSIEFMLDRGIESALAFDRHFRESGVRLPGDRTWLSQADGDG